MTGREAAEGIRDAIHELLYEWRGELKDAKERKAYDDYVSHYLIQIIAGIATAIDAGEFD